MKKKMSKARTGGFILGSIAFFIVCLITLGGRDIFSDSVEYVLYFDGSVSGLSLGAPVVFRGVPLGKVTQIILIANTQSEEVTIPVHIAIDPKSIVHDKNSTEAATSSEHVMLMQRMIQRGLRARLNMRSLITGQYSVDLDFFPETPARYHSADHSREIPTVPSTFDEFQRTLSRLPLEEMSRSLHMALDSVAKLSSNEDLLKSLTAIRMTFENTAKFTEDAVTLRDDLQRTLNALGDTSTTIDNQLPQIMATLQLTIASIRVVADDLRGSIAEANKLVAPTVKVLHGAQKSLDEISKASKAVGALARMIEKNPRSLILGKGAR